MIIKYVTSDGREVNLNKEPYKMLVSDLINYEWDIISQANKIVGFGYKVRSKKLNIDVHRTKECGARRNMSKLTDLFETDVHRGIPGRLYIDNQYLTCFIYSSDKSNWGTDNIISCEYGIATDEPFWITEQHISLLPTSRTMSVQNGMGFPLGFPFGFAPKKSGVETARIDHYKDNDFKMVIYGPCTDPLLKINDYPYQVFSTLKESEYIEINSKNNTVIKVNQTGVVENIYNSRSFTHSVFKQIPSGGLNLIWDGNFGIDITLYLERSEPKW